MDHLFVEPSLGVTDALESPHLDDPHDVRPLLRAAGSFARIEDKFLVPQAQHLALIDQVSSRLPLSPFSGKSFTEIESVYYDSDRLVSFTDHFNAGHSKFKLRTRRYAPDGVYGEEVYHLELKTKKADGISRKSRFKVAAYEVSRLSMGLPLHFSPAVVELNSEMETRVLAQRLRHVNELVGNHVLRPMVRVNYHRIAFEEEDLRVTIDQHVRFESRRELDLVRAVAMNRSAHDGAEAMRDRFESGKFSLLEVKHSGTIPGWLRSFLAQREIDEVSFSKYCFAISSLAEPTRQGYLS